MLEILRKFSFYMSSDVQAFAFFTSDFEFLVGVNKC